jgi:hypothetical protein
MATAKQLCQDNLKQHQDLHWVPTEYKTTMLPLYQLALREIVTTLCSPTVVFDSSFTVLAAEDNGLYIFSSNREHGCVINDGRFIWILYGYQLRWWHVLVNHSPHRTDFQHCVAMFVNCLKKDCGSRSKIPSMILEAVDTQTTESCRILGSWNRSKVEGEP